MPDNRHILVAVVVAPVLSILAWLAVGELTGETARPALPGASYPLLEKSNCRYASGICDLENADLKVSLSYQEDTGLWLLSSHALDGVLVSIGLPGSSAAPGTMMPVDSSGQRWQLALQDRPGAGSRIRLVASAANSQYFGEAGSVFLQTAD